MNKSKNINQTIQIQTDSTVSKEIVSKSTGTVTLFAFDKSQGLSEHKTPYDALVVMTEGLAEITVAGEKSQVGAGEMLLMPANSPHSLMAIEPFKMMLIMIKS